MVIYRSRQFSYQNSFAAISLVLGLVAVVVVLIASEAWVQVPVLGIILVGMLIAFLFVPLTITVGDEGGSENNSDAVLHVNLAGLLRRSIALSDVSKVERRDYRPLREFGGWGWRQAWTRKADAYATLGTSAVVLTLHNGAEVYLGVSDEPGLIEALKTRIYR